MIGDFNQLESSRRYHGAQSGGRLGRLRSRYRIGRLLQVSPGLPRSAIRGRQGGSIWFRRGDSSADCVSRLGSRELFLAGSKRGWRTEQSAIRSDSPISIYEVHLGSWRRVPEEGNRWLTYREMAPLLADYVHEAGFTHVEFLPIMEHPFDGSWGYQVDWLFRSHQPVRNALAISCIWWIILHQRGIGVILDWVPAHFPKDEAGLGLFRRFSPVRACGSETRRNSRTGILLSSIMAAMKCRTFSSAMLCSGSTNTMWTVCVWTRSLQCCISITAGAKASGYRTAMAARKTSKRFNS